MKIMECIQLFKCNQFSTFVAKSRAKWKGQSVISIRDTVFKIMLEICFKLP